MVRHRSTNAAECTAGGWCERRSLGSSVPLPASSARRLNGKLMANHPARKVQVGQHQTASRPQMADGKWLTSTMANHMPNVMANPMARGMTSAMAKAMAKLQALEVLKVQPEQH